MQRTHFQRLIEINEPETFSVWDDISLWSSYFGSVLLEHLPIVKGMTVLDVGCGAGFPLFEIAMRLDSDAILVGVDNWATAIQRAEHKKKVYGLTNVHLIQASAEQLPLPDNSYDLVVSNLGINNFENPVQALLECNRVLKKGGSIMLTTNPIGHMDEFYRLYEQVLEETGKPDYIIRLLQQEVHRGSLDSITEWLQSTGFSMDKIIKRQFQWRYIDGTAFLNHFFIQLAFLEGWKNILAPEDQNKIFGELEQRMNQVAHIQKEWKVSIPVLLIQATKS